jgi:outer membrane protein OmpA-like peptidoglycan-associated protein
MIICIERIRNLCFIYLLFLISIFVCIGADDSDKIIQWAGKVIGYSSELGAKQYSAEQALGKPNVLPSFGFTPCAWTPRYIRSKDVEYLHLGFTNPQYVRTILVNLNNSQNLISQIYLFDENNSKYLVYFKQGSEPPGQKGRMFKVLIEKTPYKAKSILIEFKTSAANDFLQVDAVGISEYDASLYQVKINEIKIPDSELQKPVNLGLKVNSPAQELAPIVVPDGHRLYFTREGHPANFGQGKRQDIWYSELDSTGEFDYPNILGPPINNDYHNFAFATSADGNSLLLGNVYFLDGSMGKGVSVSRFNGRDWEFPKKIEIEEFDNLNEKTAYFLSASGKILIMSIETEDSFGGLDLYVSFLQDDGRWSKPLNLGSVINTAADETSPFLAYDDETLYFSTSGFPGYGSTDIFFARRLDTSWQNWSEPVNLGKIVNSESWDAYFNIPASGDYAFFVSTNNSFGKEDIFKVYLPKALRPKPVVIVYGRVLNKKTNQPLEATIQYETLPDGKIVGIAKSNPLTGEYKIVLPGGAKYGFLAQADSFVSVNENIDIRTDLRYQEIHRDLYLVPLEIGETVRLNNIFFDYNQYTLLEDSYSELNRLIKLLKDNPNMEIEIAGHTDNIGSPTYNLDLSRKRAQSVADYLIANGLNPRRLKVKGYGERLPISSNDTDEGRQLNRRVEFKILKR